MKFKTQSKVAQRGRPRWWACNFGAGRATGRGAGPAGRPTVREEHGLPLARVLIPRAPPHFAHHSSPTSLRRAGTSGCCAEGRCGAGGCGPSGWPRRSAKTSQPDPDDHWERWPHQDADAKSLLWEGVLRVASMARLTGGGGGGGALTVVPPGESPVAERPPAVENTHRDYPPRSWPPARPPLFRRRSWRATTSNTNAMDEDQGRPGSTAAARWL